MTIRSSVRSSIRSSVRSALGTGGGFNLPAFMAGQSAGFSLDYTQTDRHWQTNLGEVLGDDVGETIGLSYDDRTWLGATFSAIRAAASELVVNGTFTTDTTGWATVAGTATLAVVSGELEVTNVGAAAGIAQSTPFATTVGTRVDVTYTARRGSSSSITIQGRAEGGSGTPGVTLTSPTNVDGRFSFPPPDTSSVIWGSANQAVAGRTGYFDNLSAKIIPGLPADQTVSNYRPTRQASGAKFDGSDDRLLSTYAAAAGANFIVALVTVPATIGATQVVAGASGASGNRSFLALNTSGQACGGVGSDSVGTIVGTTDLRDQEVVIGLSCDGSNVRLFAGNALEYEAAQNSTPTTSVPYTVGANNGNGTPGSFFGGHVKRLLVGREFLTLSRYRQIRNALLAS